MIGQKDRFFILFLLLRMQENRIRTAETAKSAEKSNPPFVCAQDKQTAADGSEGPPETADKQQDNHPHPTLPHRGGRCNRFRNLSRAWAASETAGAATTSKLQLPGSNPPSPRLWRTRLPVSKRKLSFRSPECGVRHVRAEGRWDAEKVTEGCYKFNYQ